MQSPVETASRLQDICLQYIASNIRNFSTNLPTSSDETTPNSCRRGFRCSSVVFLHPVLADSLLAEVSNSGNLDDESVAMFNSSQCTLKCVKLKESQSGALTCHGLRALKQHRIVELSATGLISISVGELISCLSEWSLENLRVLNVSGGSFCGRCSNNGSSFIRMPARMGVDVVITLSSLKQLRVLDVSYTTFNTHALSIITADLPCLEQLDISGTNVGDLSPLLNCRQRLKSLSMFNVRLPNSATLLKLDELRHLDVSDDFSAHPYITYTTSMDVNDILTADATVFPHLMSLDISGKSDVCFEQLRCFLECHKRLQFLGLALLADSSRQTDEEREVPEFLQGFTLTGEMNEVQVMESLRRYHARPAYVKHALLKLFRWTQKQESVDLGPGLLTEFIKVILPAMQHNMRDMSVQLAATACCYNLIVYPRGSGEQAAQPCIHPRWLVEIVALTLDAMENFPTQQQLNKNCLMMLCSDGILQDLSFDKYRCAKLVLDSLCAFDDQSMTRLAVAICGILAAKIPTEQTSRLGGNSQYMRRLLKIVKHHTEQLQADVTLKFTLSALWNLSDEAPSTCEVFVEEGGLDIFMDVYAAFRYMSEDIRVQIEVKLLGFLNNMAEVRSLRKHLLKENVIIKIRELLHSNHQDLSYFSAGILAHLLSGGSQNWTLETPSRSDIVADLKETVLNWKQPDSEMVAYRSFVPFFPLLDPAEEPATQLWALWAWHHVCSMNATRYCSILVEQGCGKLLLTLLSDSRTDPSVADLACRVIDVVTATAGQSWWESQKSLSAETVSDDH